MVHKHNTKDILDRFYTKDIVVNFCLQQINLNHYDLIIEPSAGAGAFSNKIPNCLAFDIAPAHSSVITQDFLNYTYDGNISRDKILCLGNPPYGRQGSLVIQFMKKCAEFADTIAFIVPRSFKKPSMLKRLPSTYHLMQHWDLAEDSFLLNNESYSVPCIFGIWQNLYAERDKEVKVQPVGFRYVKKEESNCCVRRVGVNAGRSWLDCNDKSEQSHYFLLADKPEELVNYLNGLSWEHNTTGPKSISKNEVNKVIKYR